MAGEPSHLASGQPQIDAGQALVSDQAKTGQAPVSAREVIAIGAWTLLADVLIFRTSGYSGPACFLAVAPLLFFIGCAGKKHVVATRISIALIALVSARLIWSGSMLAVLSGFTLVVALAMSAAGFVPYVLEGCVLAGRAIFDGAQRLTEYRLPGSLAHDASASHARPPESGRSGESEPSSGSKVVALVLPVATAVVFGAIFVFANPDFQITIHDVALREIFDEGTAILATYLERQTGARATTPADNDRLSTAIMRRDGDHLIWLHLHETLVR